MESSKERIEAQICAYVDGDLSGEELAEIERHLASNPQHRALIRELMAHKAMLQELPRARVPGDLNEGLTGQLERHSLLGEESDQPAQRSGLRIHRWPQLASVAAVILLATGLGLVVYYVLPPGRQDAAKLAIKDKSAEKSAIAMSRDPRGSAPAGATTTDYFEAGVAKEAGNETELRLSKSPAEFGVAGGARAGAKAGAGPIAADKPIADKLNKELHGEMTLPEIKQAQAGSGAAGNFNLSLKAGETAAAAGAKPADSVPIDGTGLVDSTPGKQVAQNPAAVPGGLRAESLSYNDATVHSVEIVGLEQARQALEQQLYANYRFARANPATPANAAASSPMLCMVVSTDSPAALSGQVGEYLRGKRITYAFSEVGDVSRLLGERAAARGRGESPAEPTNEEVLRRKDSLDEAEKLHDRVAEAGTSRRQSKGDRAGAPDGAAPLPAPAQRESVTTRDRVSEERSKLEGLDQKSSLSAAAPIPAEKKAAGTSFEKLPGGTAAGLGDDNAKDQSKLVEAKTSAAPAKPQPEMESAKSEVAASNGTQAGRSLRQPAGRDSDTDALSLGSVVQPSRGLDAPQLGRPAVPAGNGVILARMSRRQLNELTMKLNTDPLAQKTDLRESAQVALEDLTFKVAASPASTAATATVTGQSAAHAGPRSDSETANDPQSAQKRGEDTNWSYATRPAAPSRGGGAFGGGGDAGIGGATAGGSGSLGKSDRAAGRGYGLEPATAPPATAPSGPATRPGSAPVDFRSGLAQAPPAGGVVVDAADAAKLDPMEQPIEVLILVQRPEAAAAAAANPANPKPAAAEPPAQNTDSKK
jgi:hypothetical protein